MRLALATTTWRRPVLTDLVLEQVARVRDELADVLDLELVAVGSEGAASREAAERHGWRYIEHDNRPVGAKHNRAAAEARALEVEGLIVIGSDDVVNAGWIEAMAGELAHGVDVSGPSGVPFFQTVGDDAGRLGVGCEIRGLGHPLARCARPMASWGAGRIYSRRLLEALDWAPWSPARNRGLDASAWTRAELALPGFEATAIEPTPRACFVDVKTDVGITEWHKLAPLLEWVDDPSDWLVPAFGVEVTDRIVRLAHR